MGSIPMIDVKHVNCFLQSSISVVDTVTQVKLTVGKPEKTDFKINKTSYVIQVGVVGEMKGQVMLAIEDENAKDIASRMMFGMEVKELDEMASSALNELGNMIMGNTATIFSTQGIKIDITPPLSVYGNDFVLKTDIAGIKVPLYNGDKSYIDLYICVTD
ncbi:MAG: chemotaxis protein CheX [Lachnospiraceae bacterium]|nr:chemotaxis protein CheX [Lachnospiraceae bacterium]